MPKHDVDMTAFFSLSSPRCGGHSSKMIELLQNLDFLPRVAGVTPKTTTTRTRAFDFLPRVAGVTPCDFKAAPNAESFFPALRGLLLFVATPQLH